MEKETNGLCLLIGYLYGNEMTWTVSENVERKIKYNKNSYIVDRSSI